MNGVQLVGRLIKDVDLGYEPDELNNTITNLIENRINDYNYKIDTDINFFIYPSIIYPHLNNQNYSLLSCRNVKITFFIEYYNYWNLNSKYHD